MNQDFDLQEVPVQLLQVEQSLGAKQRYRSGPRLKCESLESLIKVCEKYVNIPSEKYIYVHIYVCICVYTYLCKMDEYWSYAGWS